MSLRARLIGLLLFGIILIAFWDHSLLQHLGIALIVAAVLRLTVDFTLKAEVARDVSKATLGYILRPEFRPAEFGIGTTWSGVPVDRRDFRWDL